MGAKSTAYQTSLTAEMKKAENDVMRCNQFMIGIDASRSDMEKSLAAIHTKWKTAPAQTFEHLAAADPEMKTLGEKYGRSSQELDDYKAKFSQTIVEAGLSLAKAGVVATNFEKFCTEKASKWNPLKRKSLGKSLEALTKAKKDLLNFQTLLDGVIAMQKAKGNIA